jgi:hypothetical protein
VLSSDEKRDPAAVDDADLAYVQPQCAADACLQLVEQVLPEIGCLSPGDLSGPATRLVYSTDLGRGGHIDLTWAGR